MTDKNAVNKSHISIEEAKDSSVNGLIHNLSSSKDGLSTLEAKKRLQHYGYNAITEKRVHPLLKLLSYFWGPIPWMIEIAAILSALVKHWADLIIILVLLVINAVVGFWHEYEAGNAIEQLKKKLAPKALALRDSKWQLIEARELVPGDIGRLRLGDIVPADMKLIDGDYLSIDQSVLTGESLPVDKKALDIVYSGSIVKQGEMTGLVIATGMHTYFGKTASLVEEAKSVSHFQKAVLLIGDYLIYIAIGLAFVLLLVGLERHWPFLELLQFVLILTIASIPVAMPAVLTVTMAVGALTLSKMGAIVSRLESIEEMAGIDLLFADKTGTLTQNKLTLGETVTFAARDSNELILAAALASKSEDQDAIDLAILKGLKNPEVLSQYRVDKFIPFNPVDKRTEACIKGVGGERVYVTKGAPQVIIGMSVIDDREKARAEKLVEDFATRGYRTLGVARSKDHKEWTFLGIIPLYDPPREDAAQMIDESKKHGVSIKMVTGDNTAIGREIAKKLGLGENIKPADQLQLMTGAPPSYTLEQQIEEVDGFSQVFPEHKYILVRAAQHWGHLVGMTGDGVNDAPALKQADAGIAVAGATDAARAAADLVLTLPGLRVIVVAIEEARRIFERMNSYAIYRIAETIRIMFFITLSIVIYNFYPINAIMIILLALLNDIPIMTIAKDNTWLDPKPVRWEMRRVMTVATVLGLTGVISSFGLLIIARSWLGMDTGHIQSVIFLKLIVAGHVTLFLTRTRKPFWTPPYPAPILLFAIIGTEIIGTLIVGFGLFVTKLPWSHIGLIWLYAVSWFFINDFVKLRAYKHLDIETKSHRDFLSTIKHPIRRHIDKRTDKKR
jgi:H+-transporting ATPase